MLPFSHGHFILADLESLFAAGDKLRRGLRRVGRVPVSTTHTIAGAIVGVGAARRTSAVRWGVARRIVIAWIITMPMAGLMAALAYLAAGTVLK